jgi:hypothetical protein
VLIALLAALTAYVWSSLRPTRCEGRRAVVRERYPNLDVGNDDPGLKAERQVVIEQTQAAGVGVLLGWPRARGWPGG